MNPASKQINKLPNWIWSSTQSGALYAWSWYSGSWDGNLNKNLSDAVVPFFAIKKESTL